MKRVSFKVAKAIKNSNYPQKIGISDKRYIIGPGIKTNEPIESIGIKDEYRNIDYVLAPTYIELWLWLWQEKKIAIEVNHSFKEGWFSSLLRDERFSTQEDAILAAIEYLVDNNLVNSEKK